MTRKPAVAGQFYESDKTTLSEQVKACFKSELGPGTIPEVKESKRRLLGAVSPHAGFMFSGPAAAYVYNEIAVSKKPDLFIILGPNHTGMGRTSAMLEDFETPLGKAQVDAEFGKLLVSAGAVEESNTAHIYEHSIEVQLPFLQFLFKDDFKFLPIVVSSPIGLDKISQGIRDAIEKTGKEVCIIASSDFTHFGRNFNYVPFEENIKERIKNLDMGAIELIQKKDYKGFENYVNETGATICGRFPISLLMQSIDYNKCSLLKYYTSGEITGEYDSSVSYASLIFE